MPQGSGVKHPVTAGFIFLYFYIMLNSNKNQNISDKSLKLSLECISELTEASAEISAIFHTYQTLVEETELPVDAQVLEECANMFQAMNLMLLKQQAEITHLKQMKASMKKSEKVIKDFKARKASRKPQPKQEATLFTQAS